MRKNYAIYYKLFFILVFYPFFHETDQLIIHMQRDHGTISILACFNCQILQSLMFSGQPK